jgi:hypothetical protein
MSQTVSEVIPNLINGISQQPQAIRLNSQAELQENAMPSVVEGLTKRPPTKHVAKIVDGQLGGAFVHPVSRDASERYIVVVTDGQLKVFDLDGVEQTVNAPDGLTYLASSDPANDFRATTVADHTFIVNRSIEPAMSSATTDANENAAMVWIKEAVLQQSYSIEITDDTTAGSWTATFTVNAGENQTNVVANTLRSRLNDKLPAVNWEPCHSEGSVIFIKKKTAGSFTIRVWDSMTGNGMSLIKERVEKFSDLPETARPGYRAKVVRDAEAVGDDYWVKFVPHNEPDDPTDPRMDWGVWEECPAPGIVYQLDSATMPHGLARESDGTFTFKPFDGGTYASRDWPVWGERTCGDEETAQEPSFIGRTINDVFFWKNRLGLLADENIILSRSGEFFSFFRETVTALLDSDPVDVATSHTQVSILRWAVPFHEQLLLFSDQTQFVMTSDDQLLTPETASIVVTTRFESSLEAKPQGVGPNVYFATASGGYAGLREYYVAPDTRVHDAADVTGHVPKYIQGAISGLAASDNENVICCKASGDPDALFIYKYLWQADQKIQSAWCKFILPGDVIGMTFMDSDLYLVLQDASGVHLETMSFDPGRVDTDSSYVTHLDRRVSDEDVSVSYDAVNDRTTWTLPYDKTNDTQIVTRAKLSGESLVTAPGVALEIIEVVGQESDEISVSGDHSTTPVWIGQSYRMRYRFSTPTMRRSSESGAQLPVMLGRLQIQMWSVSYDDSGHFEALVLPTYGSQYTYSFTCDSTSSGPELADGVYHFPVRHRSDKVDVEIRSDSYLPVRLVQATWEARYSPTARR